MPLTTYYKDKLIEHTLRNNAYTSPAATYLGLFTAAPTEAGGGTEVSGGSYARQVYTVSVPTDGVTSNSGDIVFPTATANWGVIVAVGVFDAVSGGNLLMYVTLNPTIPINIDDVFKFLATKAQFQLA